MESSPLQRQHSPGKLYASSSSEEDFESFHYHIMELLGGIAMNIASMRSFLTQKFNTSFEYNLQLRVLERRVDKQVNLFHRLFSDYREELSHYVVKKNTAAYREMHKSLFLFKRLTYFISLVDEE
ncbi:hypothetical protein GE061_020302 [Apolygus lucorum]|uniref:Uncharacterized protein n=1 Tax=Apolygus lucorum TaxID=248454 RepID=A0A8S9WJH1_APOLU|nr:hypothetical protein GE061_020302 [Apolygus lucorum]